MVMDELLQDFNKANKKGGSIGSQKTSAMAFADDRITLQDAEEGVPIILKQIETFPEKKGM